jgi:hypothetical protein
MVDAKKASNTLKNSLNDDAIEHDAHLPTQWPSLP